MKVWFEATNLKAELTIRLCCQCGIFVWCKLSLDGRGVLCGNIDLFHIVKVECVHSSIDGEHAGIVTFIHFLNFCGVLEIVASKLLVVILVVPHGCTSLTFDAALIARLGICLITYLVIPCLVGTLHCNLHLGDTVNTLLSVVQISGEYGVYPPLSSSAFVAAERVVDVILGEGNDTWTFSGTAKRIRNFASKLSNTK